MKLTKKRKQDEAGADTEAGPGDQGRVMPLVEALLGVHSCASPSWLADAASTAAERGLGALYGLLYLEDAFGRLSGERPASSERMRALAKMNQILGTNVTTLRFEPEALPAVRSALEGGRATATSELAQALPVECRDVVAAQRRLGISDVWLAPLVYNGERLGLLVLLMPAHSPSSLDVAELLGQHLAVALRNLKEKEAGRKRGELDPVRWVYDQHRLEEQLAGEIFRAKRHERQLSVLLLQLANLQALRERYGRYLADRLLRHVGTALETAMRHTDFLGAFQQESFAVILVEADAGAAELAKSRMTAALAKISPEPDLPGLQLEVVYATASMPADGETPQDLLAAADARLAEAVSEPVSEDVA